MARLFLSQQQQKAEEAMLGQGQKQPHSEHIEAGKPTSAGINFTVPKSKREITRKGGGEETDMLKYQQQWELTSRKSSPPGIANRMVVDQRRQTPTAT